MLTKEEAKYFIVLYSFSRTKPYFDYTRHKFTMVDRNDSPYAFGCGRPPYLLDRVYDDLKEKIINKKKHASIQDENGKSRMSYV